MKEARQKKDIRHDFMYVKFQKIPLYSDKSEWLLGWGVTGGEVWEEREKGGIIKGQEETFGDDGCIYYLGCDNAFKTHQIVHFIYVQFIVYHLYLNKAEKPSILKAFKRK